MEILLVNDDGIYAKGILTLAKVLSKKHSVTVVAPHTQMSGKSHSLTFYACINCIKLNLLEGVDCYAISGTPADCTKFGIEMIIGHKPDLVISGINNGYNLGTDVYYSGTVGASMEAIFMGVPSIAISQNYHLKSFEFAANFLEQKLDTLYSLIKDEKKILSINIPYDDEKLIKGVKFAKVGTHIYKDQYINKGLDGYFLTGEPIEDVHNDDDADVLYVRDGYITISPIRAEFNDFDLYAKFKELNV